MSKNKPVEKVLPDLIAPLQLENYIVDELTFKSNAASPPTKTSTSPSAISINFDVKPHASDKNRFLILMDLDLNKGLKADEYKNYQVHLHILGYFKFANEIDDKTKHRMIFANGSSILYGIARTVVASLTGSIGPERFILPSLNLLAVIRDKVRAEKASPAKTRKKA